MPSNISAFTNDSGYITSFTDTKYDLLVPTGTTKIRLEGATESGNTDDDVEIAAGGGISVTRDNANKLTIANTDRGSSVTGGVTRTIIRAFGSSTQNYVPTSGTKAIQVYCIAGGGGSASTLADTTGEQDEYGASSGGGGGGACIGYYNITGSFSASIQVGGGGAAGNEESQGQARHGQTGGESRFTPSGSYTGNGTLDANGGGGGNSGTGHGQNGKGGSGGSASGGFPLAGNRGDMAAGNTFQLGVSGLSRQYPGSGGHPGFVFGQFGSGGDGVGPVAQESNGVAGNSGVVVIYEYLT